MASRARMHRHLLALEAALPMAERVASDPVQIPRRYAQPLDVEIAAVFASQLAYGKVSLFLPVLDELCRRWDALGGPAAAAQRSTTALLGHMRGLGYRWNRETDFAWMLHALGRVQADMGSLEAAFTGADAREWLTTGVGRIRQAACEAQEVSSVRELSRGLRYWLSTPEQGSACKRWNLFLRWMVRDNAGVDLGAWSGHSPAGLVIPLDTHVQRMARFLGLTARQTVNWRMAEEVTAGLASLEPSDPVRFDFALAHLGISGQCIGRRNAEICPSCPLDPICCAPTSQ